MDLGLRKACLFREVILRIWLSDQHRSGLIICNPATFPCNIPIALVNVPGLRSSFFMLVTDPVSSFLCGRAVADYYNVIKHFRVFAQVYYKLCLDFLLVVQQLHNLHKI